MNDHRPTASDNGHKEERPGEVAQERGNPDVRQTDKRGSAVKKGCKHELQSIRGKAMQDFGTRRVP